MRRREFITLLGGAAAAWPLAARAQPSERMRRVGLLIGLAEDDQEAKDREQAVRDGLQKLGWIDGRNVQIDVRKTGGAEHLQAQAAELVKLEPDVIVAAATTALAALQKTTTAIPIVFAQVTDPVGAGFVQSMAGRAAISRASPSTNSRSA
jgi:putative ABC transport system substrate-binding protein